MYSAVDGRLGESFSTGAPDSALVPSCPWSVPGLSLVCPWSVPGLGLLSLVPWSLVCPWSPGLGLLSLVRSVPGLSLVRSVPGPLVWGCCPWSAYQLVLLPPSLSARAAPAQPISWCCSRPAYQLVLLPASLSERVGSSSVPLGLHGKETTSGARALHTPDRPPLVHELFTRQSDHL
ncbi:unnamed protein product [Boreogadus saida]